MIHTSLTDIRDVLNENLKNEFSISENKVVLSNMSSSDEVNGLLIDGKIVLFLVGLEEEAALRNHLNRSLNSDTSSVTQKRPHLHLKMHVVFCSNFSGKHYPEGLRYLSSVVKFFQTNKTLRPSQTNNSPNSNYRLTFDLCKLDFGQLSHLWSAVGSNLMPSALYKIGVLVFDDMPIEKVIPAVSDPTNTN